MYPSVRLLKQIQSNDALMLFSLSSEYNVKYSMKKNLRYGSSEVDSCQLRVSGHSLAKHGAVGGQEVDNSVGKASITEDFVDEVVGQDSCVTGLPQGYITLKIHSLYVYNIFFSNFGTLL